MEEQDLFKKLKLKKCLIYLLPIPKVQNFLERLDGIL